MSWFGYPLIGGVMNALAVGVATFCGGVNPFYSFMPRLPCYTQGMNCFNAECQVRHAKTCPYYERPNFQPTSPKLKRPQDDDQLSTRTERSNISQGSARSNIRLPIQQAEPLAQFKEKLKAQEQHIKELEMLIKRQDEQLIAANTNATRRGAEKMSHHEDLSLSKVQSELPISKFIPKA